jgi:hypothetical protein
VALFPVGQLCQWRLPAGQRRILYYADDELILPELGPKLGAYAQRKVAPRASAFPRASGYVNMPLTGPRPTPEPVVTCQ